MKILAIILLLSVCCLGCDMVSDMLKGDTVPEELPPLPEECAGPSNLYENALRAAYDTLEGSQLQANTRANKLSECLKNAGLTSGQAKGIVQNIERTVREEID
jgi:hypothetical protein